MREMSDRPAGFEDGGALELSKASPLREHLLWMISSSALINVLALSLPLVMLQVFDRILPNRSVSTLTLLILGAVVAVIAETALRVVRAHLTAWTAARFEHRAMCGAASRMLAMPLHEYERAGTGAYMDKFKAVGALKDYYSGQTFQQLVDLPFTALYLVVVALIGGWLAAVPLVGFALFALVTQRMAARHRTLIQDRNSADLRRNNFLVETLGGIHSVKAMAMEALMLRRYERLQETCAALMQRMAYALEITSGLGGLFSPAMTMAVVTAGAYMVVEGQLTNGELAACLMLTLRSLSPLQKVGAIWTSHQLVRVWREDVAPLFARAPLPTPPETAPEAAGQGRLELQGVSYRFPGAETNIVDGVSLSLKPGECILIKGANGSGRTTLMHLMTGLVRPDQGNVVLDGDDVATLDPAFARSAIAYVPQRAQLFEGSILDNISAFDPGRAEEALATARDLDLGDFVSRMRRGWESVVGDAAADTTPVGHRQRIAMARALSGRPRVILFDEANTSVDGNGEAAMRRYLEEVKGKATLVLITHRPSFHKMADRVFVFEDGKLIEETPEMRGKARPQAKVVALHRDISNEEAQHSAAIEPVAEPGSISMWRRTLMTVMGSFREPSDLAVCLPALLKSLGWRGDPRDVAESLPYYAETLDVTGFLNAMAQLGFSATRADLHLGDIDKRTLPGLFLPRDGGAVVLLSRSGPAFRVYDGMVGNFREETDLGLAGTAYFFNRVEETQANEGRWVKSTLARFRPLAGQAILSAVVFGMIMLPSPLFVMAVFNRVIPSGSLDSLAFLAAGVLLSLIVAGAFVVHRARILSYIAGRIEYLFGTTVLQQILGLSPSVSERATVGAQVARLSSFEAVRDMFSGPIASTILESPAVLVFVIALGIMNPSSLLLVLIGVVAYGAMFLAVSHTADQRVTEASKTSTQRSEFLIETIAKMRAIREFGGEHIWLERFREISAEAAMAGFRAARLSATLAASANALTMTTALAIMASSVALAIADSLSVGAVVASMMLTWRILGPLQTAFNNLTRIERVRNANNQLDNLMAMKGERLRTDSPLAAREIKGRVQFARVSFRYSMNADPALLGASFEIEPGQVVAITGPNGSGKSTVLKLIAGLYQPQAGGVRIDDVDIRQIDPVELRRFIGYSPQECHLFRGTITQNLRLVQPAATDGELRLALERAGALEDVMALPKGIETRFGDNSTEQLPASLRQKLSLARVYLTNAPVLLFDEPANGLDFEGDERFMETIREMRGSSTIFFVTHRPSHIRLADQVMVFDSGYMRVIGPPDDVLKSLTSAA